MCSVLFVCPHIADAAETPPRPISWHIYGAIDGYGVLFDPVVQEVIRTVPEWTREVQDEDARDSFLITPCADSSEPFADLDRPGLYVRPPRGSFILERDVVSEKEPLLTPTGEIFYPTGYPWNLLHDRYSGAHGSWMLGEFPVVVRKGNAVAVGIDLFNMLVNLNSDWPEKRLLLGAEWVRDLLLLAGVFDAAPARVVGVEDMRLDFQAYGVNRLQIQRLLLFCGASRDLVSDADRHYREAVTAWLTNDEAQAREKLGAAFSALTTVRCQHSRLDALLYEAPHIGLLLRDKGFFELEWPAHSRRTLLSYIGQIEKHGYRVSVEGGAGCWRNLVKRFPRLGEAILEQWQAGKLDLTNGTYSLPFALLSPLTLQYWQFRVGRETFREAFGRCPDYYQAQENSLGLQTPELLRHFGYAGAVHVSQNRGTAPGEDTSFIRWQSPAGHEIQALTGWERGLTRKGVHFYLDMPVVFSDYRDRSDPMVYVNFQDLGYVFLRVQMIRAHKYAPIWGRYTTARDCFESAAKTASAPARRYTADDYQLSKNVFYWDLTNINELSQLERTHCGAGLLRQTQLATYAAGTYEELRPRIEETLPALCLQEAHDAILVQGGRIGEFRGKAATMDVPPYERYTLSQEILRLNDGAVCELADVQSLGLGRAATALFNASGSKLLFARVRAPERYNGDGLVRCGQHTYAVGPFAPFAAVPAATTCGEWTDVTLPFESAQWRVDTDDEGRLQLAYGDHRIGAVPIDSRLGEFRLQRVRANVSGPLFHAELVYELTLEGVQTVLVDVLCHREAPLAELAVRYAAGRDFDRKDRWGDCLALELAHPGPLRAVWRFNPNVRAETVEDRIASPNYLAVSTESGQPASFLNEGACLYEADREKGRVRWLFHVADETQLHRRMAVVLGRAEALELSRAWSMGVVPAPPACRSLPKLREGWESVSAETLVDGDTLLISNLRDDTVSLTFEDAAKLALRDVAGKSLVCSREEDKMTCSMGPFELGFLTGLSSAYPPTVGRTHRE